MAFRNNSTSAQDRAPLHSELAASTLPQGSSTAQDFDANAYKTTRLQSVPTIQEEGHQNDLSEVPTASEQHYKIRSALGLPAKATIKEEHDQAPHQMLFWPRVRLVLREPFTEFWGTFILIMFGCGSVAEVTLSNDTFGTYQSISWGQVLNIAA